MPCYLDRQPLFPGVSSDMTPGSNVDSDSADQLESIVRVVGTPDATDVAALVGDDADAAKAKLSRMPTKAKSDLAKIFPGAEPDAVDLLKKLLTLDPKKRFDVKQCLNHAYVATIKSATDDQVDTTGIKIDLDFDDPDTPNLRVHQLRDLIREHTKAFRDKEADDPPSPPRSQEDGDPPKKKQKT